jgi:IS5 family transposase
VNEYKEKYEAISRTLRENPEIIELAHRDLARVLSESTRGRKSDYTSEQILRSLIVMFVEGDDYRGAVIRIDTSDFLRQFVGLGPKSMMDFTFLCKGYCALGKETWQAINKALCKYANSKEKITGEKLRMDTTVYESNIHYPTDSSLLWDSWRTLSRLLRQLQEEVPSLGLRHRFHDNKVKKLSIFISRNGKSNNKNKKRKVRSAYRKLIGRVRWIAGIGREVLPLLRFTLFGCPDLSQYLPTVDKIIDQAERRMFDGEKVPASEKVYSLFEPHVELIVRGKAGKDIEFGHKVLFAQTGEKFIHHYRVFPKRVEDAPLLVPALDAHKRMFGAFPGTVATDKGFYESMKQIAKLEKNIRTVSICKKGRRTDDERERESTEEFKSGQRFRAGSEGSISVLKRVFNLGKCFFKGFKNYAASVGCAVFCHNLVLLSRL